MGSLREGPESRLISVEADGAAFFIGYGCPWNCMASGGEQFRLLRYNAVTGGLGIYHLVLS